MEKNTNKKIHKVMLVFPPRIAAYEVAKTIMPPLGISYLAASIRDRYEVQLLDAVIEGYDTETPINNEIFSFGLRPDEIKRRIIEFGPDVVGISCLFSSQFSVVAKICSIVKDISSDIVTVTGGAHPTFLPKQCLTYAKDLDYIILGEAEKSFRQLLDNLNNGASLVNIDGIAYKRGDNVIVEPKRTFIDDLDALPLPSRELLPLKKYYKIGLPMGLVSKQEPAMSMITSRGCPFKCVFCSSCNFWGNRYRMRSVERVLDEMQKLKDMGIREIKFYDDNLTLDRERAKKIFKGMIEKKFNFTWNTPNGISVQTLDEELIDLMKQSGCYEITLAIESGNEQVLRNILKKPLELDYALKMAKIIKSKGINTYGFFIIGFPQETKKQIYDTLRFMELIALDRISLFIANPLPGTEIYDYCQERGYLKQNTTTDHLDYFRSRFETPEFDSDFLEKLRRSWYWKYNFKLILRNPFSFFRIYGKFLIKRPIFLASIFKEKFLKPIIKSWKLSKKRKALKAG